MLKKLYFVNKMFRSDAQYIWTHRVEPQLSPILNVDSVAHDTSAYRPLTGVMEKWLCLPTSFKSIESIEVRVRLFDHVMTVDGDGVSTNRIVEKRIPSPKGWDWMEAGISSSIYSLVNLFTPGFHGRLADFAQIKTLKIIYETRLPDGLHFAHVEYMDLFNENGAPRDDPRSRRLFRELEMREYLQPR